MRGAFRHTITQRKILVGYIGPSTVQSRPCAQRFHMFLHLKKYLAGKKFDDDDEVQEEVMTWFREQAADFYDSGI